MVTQAQAPGEPGTRIQKIVVRIQTGEDRMAATDDPVYLRLVGPHGRDFRLQPAKGKAFRRGHEDEFVLAGLEAAETNVAEPELNDPRTPAIGLDGIERIELVKGTEPLPNVRGMGEMDDRIEIARVEVALWSEEGPEPVRFRRDGPIWLGMVCGMSVGIPPEPASS